MSDSDQSRAREQAVNPKPNGRGKLTAVTAVTGASLVVLMVELARSGALEQYKDLIAPLIGWGPGLLVLAGFLWLANSYAPPLIEAQAKMARNMGELAGAIRENLGRDDDVRDSLRTVAAKLDRQHEAVVGFIQEIRAATVKERTS